MEIRGSYYFEGAAYLVVVQLILIAVLNLFSGKQHQMILGIILLLFADAIRNSFLYNYLNQPDLKVVIGNLHLNVFFGPLLLAFMKSITGTLNVKFKFMHFTFPTFYVLGVMGIALSNYFGIIVINPNIYLYETKLAMFLLYFCFIVRLTKTKRWRNTRHHQRYIWFFWILSTFLFLSLIGLVFSKHFYEAYMEVISFFLLPGCLSIYFNINLSYLSWSYRIELA